MTTNTSIAKCSVILAIVFLSFNLFAQNKSVSMVEPGADQANTLLVPTMVFNGEALPTITIREFQVISERIFKSEKDKHAYLKLKRDVLKVYPYAVLASVKLREYDAIMATLPEKERSVYMKRVEKELKEQFEDDLKKLTINQGKILIRLIDRETGKSTYRVIKEYRGTFQAFMWQSIGLLWGNNLKAKFDPTKGEDKLIEEIIQEIQDNTV
jgi:hypothetical protein